MGKKTSFIPDQEYIDSIYVKDPSFCFQNIKKAANDMLLRRTSDEERDQLWEELDRGKKVIDDERLLWKYLCSYENMHSEKLNVAFGKIRRDLQQLSKSGQECTIIDWGCGQGLATCCLLDYLNKIGAFLHIQHVILIEPSELALEYANLHLCRYGIKESVMKKVGKGLDDTGEDDIERNSPVTFHLFSNILDMPQFDLKHLAQIIGHTSTGTDYLVCVSPYYPNSRRLEEFYRYFIDVTTFQSDRASANDEDRLALIARETTERDADKNYTMELVVFKYEHGKSSVASFEHYPPVQFFAGYELDCTRSARRQDASASKPDLLPYAFNLAAPFDLGAHVYDDVHPVLAVLNNIITRGCPTRCSPLVEKAFSFAGNTRIDNSSTIEYECEDSSDSKTELAKLYTPIGVAWIQKTIIEALINGVIDSGNKIWKVLVIEHDAPCSALAVRDLRQLFNNISALSVGYSGFVLPEIELTVVSNKEWTESPLHEGALNVVSEIAQVDHETAYDMLLDIAVNSNDELDYSSSTELKVAKDCRFAIRPSESVHASRKIYTSERIDYLPLGANDAFGTFETVGATVDHLRYFLNLIFRKVDFKPGQIPILNRALQNTNVIGLLPTGGGKSLTYQLAAMLQPGVALIIDPLRALMQDQYEGLIENGIDTCSFINSTLNSKEMNTRSRQLQASELQFIFVSPERLCIQKFRRMLSIMHEMHVYFSYGVIDEVHCVSEWGHDFRFSYLHLGRNLYNFVHTKDANQHIPLFGLTATASFDVLADVERELSGDNAYPLDPGTVIRYEDTDRLELQYRIVSVPISLGADKFEAYERKAAYLQEHIREIPDEINTLIADESIGRIKERFAERHGLSDSFTEIDIAPTLPVDIFAKSDCYESAGIIFCPHRKNTAIAVEEISDELSFLDTDIGTFVGSSGDRTSRNGKSNTDEISFRNLKLFKGNKQSLMVATKAFGMGIDKPNIRFTVNMNYSSSLESFVQEAGRAGRDGKIALAEILVSDYRGNRGDGNVSFRKSQPDADYECNMFFFDQNFPGPEKDKRLLRNYFCEGSKRIELCTDCHHDTGGGELVYDLIAEVLARPEGTKMLARLKYEEYGTKVKIKPCDHIDFVHKAIYRMCCAGFVDDYTQDYNKKTITLEIERKSDGSYYQALEKYLRRYYTDKRAAALASQIPTYHGSNEVQKCIEYLIDFAYKNIAVKRKRALDDMKQFCLDGLNSAKTWQETNEDLKDFIYYYFNSKYAKDDYVSDGGEPFSLTADTDNGKISSSSIVMKYLRVVDDDLVGAGGTPKENVKHLQGAVRLIRRALAEPNPALTLLNFFCLLYLGTNNNAELDKELVEDYREGLIALGNSSESKEEFWSFFRSFHEKIEESRPQLGLSTVSSVKSEVIARLHLDALVTLREECANTLSIWRLS